VLADPPVATVPGRVRLRAGRTLIRIVEEIGRHDPLESVLLGEQEGDGQLVVVVVLVGQDAAGAAVTSLG
jgi:hypothetical protein